MEGFKQMKKNEKTKKKIYQMYGINTAVHLLRPGAKWEIANGHFTRWEDPRPCPTINEIYETMEKIKAFEDSIDTIWRDDQIATYNKNTLELSKYI
jgi:hypothetical protein